MSEARSNLCHEACSRHVIALIELTCRAPGQQGPSTENSTIQFVLPSMQAEQHHCTYDAHVAARGRPLLHRWLRASFTELLTSTNMTSGTRRCIVTARPYIPLPHIQLLGQLMLSTVLRFS